MFCRRRSSRAVAAVLAALAPTYCANAVDLPVTAKPNASFPFFLSVDNRITVSHIFQGTGPGHWSRNPDGTIDGKTVKQLYSFTHFDAWTYGTNVFAVSLYKSDHNDPAKPCASPGKIINPLGAPEVLTVWPFSK